MKKEDKRFMMDMYNLATVGLNIVAGTFIGLAMGWFLDHKLFHEKTTPWCTLVFLVLGIIAGFRNVFKMVKGKLGKDDDEGGGEAGRYDDRKWK